MKLPQGRLPAERLFLPVGQGHQLLAELAGRTRVLVLLALLTGLRRGELFGLRRKHLDLDRQVIRVREAVYQGQSGLPKTKSSIRDVPMSEAVSTALTEYLRQLGELGPEDLLFADERGRPLNPQRILDEEVYPVCDRLEIPRASWHTFRHTYATLLSEQGESIKTAQALLGHRDLDTTLSVYTHAVPESQRQAVAKLSAILDPNGPKFSPPSKLTH